MSTLGPATMAAALTASAQLIESLRLERDVAQQEAAELAERLGAVLTPSFSVGLYGGGYSGAVAQVCQHCKGDPPRRHECPSCGARGTQ